MLSQQDGAAGFSLGGRKQLVARSSLFVSDQGGSRFLLFTQGHQHGRNKVKRHEHENFHLMCESLQLRTLDTRLTGKRGTKFVSSSAETRSHSGAPLSSPTGTRNQFNLVTCSVTLLNK